VKVKSSPGAIKAAGEQDGTDEGVFEAIVATYDLDSYGDKIVPGAFAETLAEWEASGNPIPVLWSHNSYDVDSHIGYVLKAEEREGVGLWVQAQLDLDAPKAQQVYRLLKGRRVTQFSFAYDVIEAGYVEQIEDGEDESYFELRKLKLYEVGPCLVGVNQQTELLDVKARNDGRAVPPMTLTFPGDVSTETVLAAVKATRGGDSSAPTVRAAPGRDHSGEAGAAKAGRTLSSKNEGLLRNAHEAIGTVLSSVEEQDDDDEKAKPVVPAPSPSPGPQGSEAKGASADAGTAEPVRHAPGPVRRLLVSTQIDAELAALA